MYLIKNRIKGLLVFTKKIEFILVIFAILLISVLEGLGIGMIFPIIKIVNNQQVIMENAFLKQVYQYFGFSELTDLVLVIIVVFAIFFVAKSFLSILFFYYQIRFASMNSAKMSSEMLRKYLLSPYPLHLQRDIAEVMTNTKDLVPMAFTNYLMPLMILCTELLTMFAITAVLFYMEPLITAATISSLGAILFIFYRYYRSRYRQYGAQMINISRALMMWLRDSFSSLKEARISNRDSYFTKGYENAIISHAKVTISNSTLNTLPRGIIESFAIVLMLGVLFFVVVTGRNAQDLMAVFGMFTLAALRLLPSANRILFNLNQAHFAENATDKILKEFKSLSDSQIPEIEKDQSTSLHFNNKLILDHIGFTYEKAPISTLKNINLEISQGESIALVGPSGAGKSTLGDLLLGLLPPNQGTMTVDGVNIFENVRNWYPLVGYVPQSIHLLNSSLKYNIAFGEEESNIDEQRIRDVLMLANLEAVVNELPDGMETLLGEEGVRLSGGQRQRVGIARALYQDPELLVFDEATSALDTETEREISMAINVLARSKTLIIIAHRLSTVVNCDRLYFMRNGMISDFGTYHELVERNADFRKFAKFK